MGSLARGLLPPVPVLAMSLHCVSKRCLLPKKCLGSNREAGHCAGTGRGLCIHKMQTRYTYSTFEEQAIVSSVEVRMLLCHVTVGNVQTASVSTALQKRTTVNRMSQQSAPPYRLVGGKASSSIEQKIPYSIRNDLCTHNMSCGIAPRHSSIPPPHSFDVNPVL